jgi:hypothetical protein
MRTVAELHDEAEGAERLARLVSFAPDRARLLEMAARLRSEARAVGQSQSHRRYPSGPH